MFSKFEFLIAFRYLKAKRKEKFISITALLSFLGIMLGVATLIIVTSVMNGFREELISKIIGVNSHITVFPKGDSRYDYNNIIKTLKTEFKDDFKTVTPIVEGQGMLLSKHKSGALIVKAMLLEDLQNKKDIYDNLNTTLDISNFNGEDFIFIGESMALGLGLGIGEKVKIMSPEINNTIIGSIPRTKTYTIGAIFKSGVYEYDSNVAFISLENGQKHFNFQEAVSGIEIVLNDAQKSQIFTFQISILLNEGGYRFNIIDWKGANSSLISALNIEKNVMFLILTLIIIVAAFNIISSLIMLVTDKYKQIALLRTIGVQKNSIMKIFCICGSLIGFVGTTFGVGLGIFIALNIENLRIFIENKFGKNLLDPTIYFLSNLPSRVFLSDVITIASMSFLLSFLATLYPAKKASKTNPAEVLRYE